MERLSHTVRTADGVTVDIACYRNGCRESALIVCPGFFQSKDTATFTRLSEALAAKHLDVVAMDFRGHGRSGGRYTFSAREGADLTAVLAWAAARYARLGVLGFSLGAAIAINTATQHPGRIQSLIAVSAPSSFEQIEFKCWTPEAMRTGLQGLERGAGCRPGNLLLKKARPIESLATLAGLPVLFVHGSRDVIIAEAHSHRLYAAAREPKRLEIVAGGSHAEALFRDEPDRFLDVIHQWLLQTLPPSGVPASSGDSPAS